MELQIDPRVKLSKGYAQIEYENAADAESAQLHMDGGQLDGNVLKVSFVLVDQQRRRRAESKEGDYSLRLLVHPQILTHSFL